MPKSEGEPLEYPNFKKMSDTLTLAFADSNREVYGMVTDVRFSGSTCVSLLTFGRKIYVANVGDSRAILIKAGSDDPKENCTGVPISRDHKPDDLDEAKVIHACGGRIDTYRDQNGAPIGPKRVWLKNEDIPGLAMTRSFGDGTAARVGVNAVPEI